MIFWKEISVADSQIYGIMINEQNKHDINKTALKIE